MEDINDTRAWLTALHVFAGNTLVSGVEGDTEDTLNCVDVEKKKKSCMLAGCVFLTNNGYRKLYSPLNLKGGFGCASVDHRSAVRF